MEPIEFAVVIPAYRPSEGLVDLIAALSAKSLPAIIVVDDGSGPAYREIFARACAYPGVEFVRHAVNLGKGAALRTAFNHALCVFPDLKGVVTADADGQHHPDDIERVAQALAATPDRLILGSREFTGDVPLRSRIGNKTTSALVHALLGQRLADTQTGLRGIPASLLPSLLILEARGYEFELEMLLAANRISMPIAEVTIRTIYEPGNKSSHFNPIIDSMKIYFVLLRFGSVSLSAALLDNLAFYLAFRNSHQVLLSQIVGRVLSTGFNYSMVRGSVFRSRQSHAAVLPRYLALVLLSGAISYGGISFLAARAGMNPVAAKLMVETVLFFLNFAIQRVFIFKPQRAEASSPGGTDWPPAQQWRPAGVRRFSMAASLSFAALSAIEIYGFYTSRLFAQEIWYPVGLTRLAHFGGIYLAFAMPLLLMAPWALATFFLFLVVVASAISVGPQAVLAVVFFLVAACALGTRIVGKSKDRSTETDLLATLAGAAVYIFLMALTARLPIHCPAVWAVLLGIPILLDFRGVIERLRRWRAGLLSLELRGKGERIVFAFFLFVLMTHWLTVLKPEVSADGLAMHLAVPMNIAAHHAMTFEPGQALWSVMPMGADWIYSITCLFGGEYAPRLLNFALLLMVATLLFCAVRRFLSSGLSFLMITLFATTPLVQLVTGSLFVENLTAVMLLGAMLAIWRFGETGQRRLLYTAAALAGTSMTVKVGALAFVVLALPFLYLEVRRWWKALGPRPAVALLLAIGILVAAAAPTYTIAWLKTGNPVFPFHNDKMPSKYMDRSEVIKDFRFRKPLTWRTPFDVTFRTNDWYEGQNGSFGFHYLVIAPLGLLAIVAVRRRAVVGSAVIAWAASVLVLKSEPNVRYIYPALPLFTICFAALLAWALAHARVLYRLLVIFLVICAGLNAWFLPSSSYYHKDFSLPSPFSRAKRPAYVAYSAPIRSVIDQLNRTHPGEAVLLTADSVFAGPSGEVFANHWHQISTFYAIRKTRTVPELAALLESWKIRYLIAHVPAPGEYAQPPVLRKLLEQCAVPEYEMGGIYLARFEPACRLPGVDKVALDAARPVITVDAGPYDDFHPAVAFRGYWIKDDKFEGPARHTISYSDEPGNEAVLTFRGTALTWIYTKAPNRGMAAVTVDGVNAGNVDLFSPKVEWQSHTRFCCFAKGRHEVKIRVAGQRNPRSTGNHVDIDMIVVE